MNPAQLKFQDDGITFVAVAITITPHGNTHSGIVYRENNLLHILNLAWHCTLQNDPFQPPYAYGAGLFLP